MLVGTIRLIAVVIAVQLTATIQALPDAYAGQATLEHVIEPGDTWLALAMRYGLNVAELQGAAGYFNTAREPTIGDSISVTATDQRNGRLIRPTGPGLLQTAVANDISVWELALLGEAINPYATAPFLPLVIPSSGEIIRDLPVGVDHLALSQTPALPGRALGLRLLAREATQIAGSLDSYPITFAGRGGQMAGVTGTGAFYDNLAPELQLVVERQPAWRQPWRFGRGEWDYQDLTLTGAAAAISQQDIQAERERLRAIWTHITADALWTAAFSLPVTDYLAISATYGGRRSYNGGPIHGYHEGVDFSAYQGTPVTAPAAGTVVLAEPLIARGGAVIVDHGMGIFTGYYHLSAIHAAAGQQVAVGDLLGEVGTTGLSTGNHLHWDLLVNGVWVDAAAWVEQDLACWLLEALGTACTVAQT